MKSLYEFVVQLTLAFVVLYGVQALVLLYLIIENVEKYNG